MNYDAYYKLCREKYAQTTQCEFDHDRFYGNPVVLLPVDKFTPEYGDTVNVLSQKVKKDFDSVIDSSDDGIMVKHNNIWKFTEELTKLSNIIVPYLEEVKYCCNLYVDKIYIYRTLPLDKRVSSYEWHYDNNPNEVIKTLIYLNDVTLDTSPFEYLMAPNDKGILGACTRRGPDYWHPAPNNSRVGPQVEKLLKEGFNANKVTGTKGTSLSFINNAIHRVNPIIAGYRDVINIRVKPTIEKPPQYLSPEWTTSYEIPGYVNPDPTLAWSVRH